MKKQKLSLQSLKDAEILSADQLKTLMGGLEEGSGGCRVLGLSCNQGVQCCSNNCAADSSDTVTGKTCQS